MDPVLLNIRDKREIRTYISRGATFILDKNYCLILRQLMEEVAHLENRNQGFSWKQIFRIILCGHHVSKAAKIARYLDFLTDSIQNYNSSAATDVESSRVVVAITSTRFLPRRGRR